MPSETLLTRVDTRHYLLHARERERRGTLQWCESRVTAKQRRRKGGPLVRVPCDRPLPQKPVAVAQSPPCESSCLRGI